MIKDIFLLIALIFFACVDSFANCVAGNYTGIFVGASEMGFTDNGEDCLYGDGCSIYPDKKCGECQACGASCPSHLKVYMQNAYYASGKNSNVGSDYCEGTNPGCYSSGCGGIYCNYEYICSTIAEADSITQAGQCDSTKWECETFTETTQTTVANEDVTCFNGQCFGGIYCEYETRNETTCTNECGTSHTEVASFPMRYDGRCNDETAPDEDQCTDRKCMTNNGFYHLYRLCKNRNLINGEAQTIPVFEGGGVGTCANAGYQEENPNVNDGDNTSTNVDSTSVPRECYTMGINCPTPSDSTDYTEETNRNQDNGCTCEPYDGQKYISQIICPDGSRSIFFGSCNDWKNPPSSSSEAPESSASGSENPPASSGAGGDVGDDRPTDWVTYTQGEQMKALLAEIALNTAKENDITINNNSNLTDFVYTGNGEDLELERTDSVLVLEPDTNGIMALRDSLFNRIFDKVDTNNTLIDTLAISSFSGCPAVRVMGGGTPVRTQSGVYIKGFTIDFCDIHGFNLVRIISVIVTSFASVVGFFVGFKIFKSAMG